jgi:hypothetical protein
MKLWYACLPNYLGYGLTAFGTSEDDAMKNLQKAYLAARPQSHGEFQTMSWPKARDYFDAHADSMEPGTAQWMDITGGDSNVNLLEKA